MTADRTQHVLEAIDGALGEEGWTVNDLTEFLLARIVEDEAECRREIADGYGGDQHESGWPSNRVLADCEAKRRIVACAVAAKSRATRAVEMDWPSVVRLAAAVAYEDAMKFHALVYADHPDYREEWRL